MSIKKNVGEDRSLPGLEVRAFSDIMPPPESFYLFNCFLKDILGQEANVNEIDAKWTTR